MNIGLECTYCGHKWEVTAYSKASIESMVCTKCKDSHLKVRDLATSKIDAYKGCPPFPEKKITLDSPMWKDFIGVDFGFAPGVD
jgi:hypothetical protein